MNVATSYASSGKNPSGYGEAARQDILALFIAGVNLTTETISQMPEQTSYGISGSVLSAMENRKIPYKVKIIHLTPDLFPQYKESGIYMIGRLFWETDRLPKEWVDPCNLMDEIWTASPQMCEMIKNSGVTTPCYSFPQPIWTDRAEESIPAFTFPYPRDFTFYSIFQWIDRKNPKGLLTAYWKAFEGNDKVSLLLKTYRIHYGDQEFDLIKKDIKDWKSKLNLNHYPKIYLAPKLLTDPQMTRLHRMGDVFVNPSSGEGWCRPMQEAMLYGKPVISGNNGGITDYITPIHYSEVQTKLKEVSVQSQIPWYQPPQKWKELDEEGLAFSMKEVYANYEEACSKARKAQKYVIENFSYQKVGQQMKERLIEIYKTL